MLTVNVGRLMDRPIKMPEGSPVVALAVPTPRAIRAGKLHHHKEVEDPARVASPQIDSTVVIIVTRAVHSKPIQRTKSDPEYFPFIKTS